VPGFSGQEWPLSGKHPLTIKTRKQAMQTHACLFFDRFVLLCRQGLFFTGGQSFYFTNYSH
jgi:hypothetical protein